MKIYTMLYNDELYAFTTRKDIRDTFKKQRSKDFIYGKIDYPGTEQEFIKEYDVSYKSELIIDILSNLEDTVDINMAMTIDESDTILKITDDISFSCKYIENNIDKFDFKKSKYRKSIEYLSTLDSDRTAYCEYTKMDTISIFIYKYGHMLRK